MWSGTAPPFPDMEEVDLLSLDSNAAQLELNNEGEALAKAFGRAMHDVGIPVGMVYTSKYNRAYETPPFLRGSRT